MFFSTVGLALGATTAAAWGVGAVATSVAAYGVYAGVGAVSGDYGQDAAKEDKAKKGLGSGVISKPTLEDAEGKAREAVKKRRKISQLTGGKTLLSSEYGQSAQSKNLLGE